MAVLNKSGNNTVSNKFIYIEPNMVEGDTKKSIPMEDLMVYFDLRVEYVPQRHIVASFGGEILHLRGIMGDKKRFVSVISGSKNEENEFFLTTSAYGNYTLDGLKENGTEELFGVESIEVSYNSYMVPEVEIKFVDIKGAALHGAEELAHGENGELIDNISYSSKFLSSFFTVPFPRFELIIKGFYGKPVYYELSCADFRSSFDSKTGNYNAVARMVGYSYALISDITTCDVLAAPYSNYYGKKYWEEQTQRGTFTSDGYALPTLQDIVSTWNGIVAKVNEEKTNISDERKQELQKEQVKLNNMTDALSHINEYIAYLIDNIKNNKLGAEYYDNEKKCLFVLKLDSVRQGNYNNAFILTSTRGIIGDSSVVTDKINSIKKLLGNDYCEWNGNVYSNVYEGTGDKTFLMDKLTSIIEEKNKDNEKIIKLFDEKLQDSKELCITFHVYDFYNLIDKLTKEIETKNSLLNQTKDELNDELTKQLMNKLNFRPSLENMCKICFAHLETFLYMFQCVKTEEERKNYDVRIKGEVKTVQKLYPIFPLCMGDFYEKGIKKTQEKWIGYLLPEKAEIKFVRGMMGGIKEGLSERLSLPIEVAEKKFYRICPMDCIEGKNPFSKLNNRILTEEFFQTRCAQLFALGLHRFQSNAQRMGELDAINYYYLYPNGYDDLESDIISEKWGKTPFKNVNDSAEFVDLSNTKINGESVSNLMQSSSDKLFKIITDNSLDGCEMIGWYEGEEKTFKVNSQNFWNSKEVDGCFDFKNYISRETAYLVPKVNDDVMTKIPFSTNGYVWSSSVDEEYDDGYVVEDIENNNTIKYVIKRTLDEERDRDLLKNEIGIETVACHSAMTPDSYTIITIPDYGDDGVSKMENGTLFLGELYTNVKQWCGGCTDAKLIYVKAFLFLSTFIWGEEVRMDKLKSLDNHIKFNRRVEKTLNVFYDSKENIRPVVHEDYNFIEVVPLFFILKIGAILFMRTDNTFSFTKLNNIYDKLHSGLRKYITSDDVCRWDNIKNGYKTVLINFFKKWVENVYVSWDKAFTNSNNDVYYRQYDEEDDRDYVLNRIKFFRDTHPIVQELTRAFFSNVVWYKYNPMVIENITSYNNTILPLILSKTLKEKNDSVYAIAFNTNIKQYMQGFQSKLKELYKDKVTEHVKSQLNEDNLNDDMEFSLYRHYKQLWDRWISNDNNSYINWKMEEVLGINSNKDQQRIHFIDCSYNQIGQDLIVNVGKFAELVSSIVEQRNMPFLTFLGYFFKENNCVLYNIQNFYNTQIEDNIQNIFTPTPYYEIDWEGIKRFSDLLVMYKYQPADSLQDSFNITDKEQSLPSHYQSVTSDNYRIPAFGVVYGMQNQNYFSDIHVSMETPNITDQVLQSTMKIAEENSKEAASDTSTAVRTVNKDMFQIYSNHSYECSVTMMGCAWIQPLMYFQLLNVPLFRGAYIIQKVSHSISAGHMVTKFTGTRISQRALKLPNQTSLVLHKNVGSNPSNINETEFASVTNDCPYAFFMPNRTDNRQDEDGDYKDKMLEYLNMEYLEDYGYTVKQRLAIGFCSLVEICHKDVVEDTNESLKVDYTTHFVFLFHNFWVQVREEIEEPFDIVEEFMTKMRNLGQDDEEYAEDESDTENDNDEVEEDEDSDIEYEDDFNVDDFYEQHSLWVDLVASDIDDCISNPLEYYKVATRTWKEKPHVEKINGVIFKNQNQNGEKIEVCVKGDFIFISNAYGDGERSYFSLEDSINEYVVDDMINVFNKTLAATKDLRDVSIEIIGDELSNKALLKINKDDAEVKANVFDMILQTYAKPYLSSLMWVAKNKDSAHESWEYIAIELAENSGNFDVGVWYISSHIDGEYNVSSIDDYQNLHEHFYASLMKKYSIDLKNKTMDDSFKLDCLNFAPLTSEEKWKEKVLEFFGENDKTKNIKVKSCDKVKNDNISKYMNGGTYEENTVQQISYDNWQFSGVADDNYMQLLNPNQIYTATIKYKADELKCENDESFTNGTCKMEKKVNSYALYARDKSHPETLHLCAKYVRMALENALENFSTLGRPNSACKYAQVLGYWGFTKIYEGMTSQYTDGFQNGDIIVTAGKNLPEFYDNDPTKLINPTEITLQDKTKRLVSGNRASKFGHIQIYYDGAWYADARFQNANVYLKGGDRPCCLFRAIEGSYRTSTNMGLREEGDKVYYGIEFIYNKSEGGINWQPSSIVKEAIKFFEGWHEGWVQCPNGYLTTGWGFKQTEKLKRDYPNGMSEDQANQYFNDVVIHEYVKVLKQIMKDMMFYNQNQMDALLSLLYNIGNGTFTKKSPNLMNALKIRNIDNIVQNMNHGSNNQDAFGLAKRRTWEQKLFKTPLGNDILEYK